jgi:hypothetical protein
MPENILRLSFINRSEKSYKKELQKRVTKRVTKAKKSKWECGEYNFIIKYVRCDHHTR